MKRVPGGKGGTIIQLEKGETSNPNGRPLGTFSISKKLKELINKGDGCIVFKDAEILNEDGEPTGKKATVRVKLPNGEALTIIALKAAMSAEKDPRYLKALEMVWDRNEGKVAQPIEVKDETTPEEREKRLRELLQKIKEGR